MFVSHTFKLSFECKGVNATARRARGLPAPRGRRALHSGGAGRQAELAAKLRIDERELERGNVRVAKSARGGSSIVRRLAGCSPAHRQQYDDSSKGAPARYPLRCSEPSEISA